MTVLKDSTETGLRCTCSQTHSNC